MRIMRWSSLGRAGSVMRIMSATADATATATADAPQSCPRPGFRPRLTYAIVPPNKKTPVDRRLAIAAAQSARIAALPIDALLVYDVQDESARNARPRPFPFFPKVDPLTYALETLQVGKLPRVVYRAIAQRHETSFERWVQELRRRDGLAVFVGAPTASASAAMPLEDAYTACRSHAPDLTFGGVMIAERHQALGDEDSRVWSKARQGCRFFVSQTVWSVAATQRLLRDVHQRAQDEGGSVPPLLVTVSPCGSPQTLEFLEWLGVEVPRDVKRDLLAAKDILERSVELATDILAEVCATAADLGLTVGCNVESVSSRPSEVEASIELTHRIDRVLAVACGG